jgi:hypothetical protein
VRTFKITISHHKQPVFSGEVKARTQPDAIDKAWRQFDPDKRIDPRDRDFETLVQT